MIVLISRVLYWGQVETGLGVIAACLPALQSLFRKERSNDLLRSLKSILEIRILHSRESPPRIFENLDNESTSSYAKLNNGAIGSGSTVETHALRDLEGQGDLHLGRIVVQHKFHHESELV